MNNDDRLRNLEKNLRRAHLARTPVEPPADFAFQVMKRIRRSAAAEENEMTFSASIQAAVWQAASMGAAFALLLLAVFGKQAMTAYSELQLFGSTDLGSILAPFVI